MKKQIIINIIVFILGFLIGSIINFVFIERKNIKEKDIIIATEIDATSTDTIEIDATSTNATTTDATTEEPKIEIEEKEEIIVASVPPTTEEIVTEYVEPELEPEPQSVYSGGHLTPSGGVFYGPNGKETYYNLDMSGVIANAQSMGIQGEYWVRNDGCKMYGDYIICAADLNIYPRGSLVESSLGTCIVLDTGSFATNGSGVTLDIAVTW